MRLLSARSLQAWMDFKLCHHLASESGEFCFCLASQACDFLLHSVYPCVYGFYLTCDFIQLRQKQPFYPTWYFFPISSIKNCFSSCYLKPSYHLSQSPITTHPSFQLPFLTSDHIYNPGSDITRVVADSLQMQRNEEQMTGISNISWIFYHYRHQFPPDLVK